MNSRQVLSVLTGALIFVAGALRALTPVEGRTSDGPAIALPLVDPVEAFASRPGPVLLAVMLSVLGVAVALLGCYAARDRD